MALFINGNNIDFKYEGQVDYILEDVTFRLDRSSRVGLVGDNGSGKTTLLHLISGELVPYHGEIEKPTDIKIGCLPQEVSLEGRKTVEEYLFSAQPTLHELREKIAAADQTTPAYADLIAEYYARGGESFEIEFAKILTAFNLDTRIIEMPVSLLSGGEKTKVAIAGILLRKPDLMLLDEPTNHLEMTSLEWLEGFLKSSPVPFLTVSHDRRFLDNTIGEIWEIEYQTLTKYSGNYSFYKKKKEQEIKREQHLYEIQQRKIRKLRQAARMSRDAAASHQAETRAEGYAPVFESIMNEARHAMKAAKRIEKRIQRMIEKEEAKKPFIERDRKITIKSTSLKNPTVATVTGLSKTYGARKILDNINLTVANGTKLGIIGRNGSGKSTFLKIIAGALDDFGGEYKWAPRAGIGYYSQEHENLDPKKTILDEVLQGRNSDQTRARTILGRLNIRRDKVYQSVATLSLGERSKTALARILFSEANVLILDEPTNHMEISAREAFEEALEDYSGTVLIATHDRYLLDRIATEILDMETGQHYKGRYADFAGFFEERNSSES